MKINNKKVSKIFLKIIKNRHLLNNLTIAFFNANFYFLKKQASSQRYDCRE